MYNYIDGKLSSLYQTMLLYEASTPNSVQRYKGLGEMSKTSMSESTLSQDSRSLIRYTMDDAKEATKIIREFESDSKKILGEVRRVTRDDLLD
jgi:DNA gyrase/topoisomerase IV subunit B